MSAQNGRPTVTVLLGGRSAEREVSLCSGQAVAQALRGLGYRVHEVDPRVDPWVLPTGTEVVVLTLHGTYGEDGEVQRELASRGVAYSGCDAEASALAFDKVATKRRLRERGVPTPRHFVVGRADADWPSGWEPPIVVKPIRQGSSVGLTMLDRIEGWAEALGQALEHDAEVMVEERIVGRELTVGILDGEALPVVEVRPLGGVYDYRSKYTAGATRYSCPAELPGAVSADVQSVGLAAFEAVGGRDYGRVDVMLDARSRPWVLEINTLPGMTETSLLPKAARAAGLDYGTLCERIVNLALKRSERLEIQT